MLLGREYGASGLQRSGHQTGEVGSGGKEEARDLYERRHPQTIKSQLKISRIY